MFKGMETVKLAQGPDGTKRAYIHRMTLNQALEYCDTLPDHECRHSVTNAPDSSWDENLNYMQTYDLAVKGDPEKLEECRKLSKGIKVKKGLGVGTGIVWNRDVCGPIFDIPAYLSGVPECAFDGHFKPIPQKVVSLIAHIGNNCSITAQALTGRGTAIMAAILALELKGYSVELVVTEVNRSGDNCGVWMFPIKRAGQRVEPAIVAFWLARPAAFRRLFFRLMELSPEYKNLGMNPNGYSNYGYTCGMPKEIPGLYGYSENRWIMLPQGDNGDVDPNKPLRGIVQILKGRGIELELGV